MRLIVTGDWHLDTMTAGRSRLPEQQLVLDQLQRRVMGQVEQCARDGGGESVVVVFLGDLCNPEKGGRTLAAIEEAARVFWGLEKSGASVLAIAGNHDVTDSAEGLTVLNPLAQALRDKRVWVATTPRVVQVAEMPNKVFRFMLLPYMAPSCLARWEAGNAPVASWVNANVSANTIVAGHLCIEGALLGSETLDMPRGRENQYPVRETGPALLRLNGHYHKRQSPHGIWCPGAPVRLAFGEETNPTGWLEWRL